MNNPEVFRPRSEAEIDAMIASNPLALVISADGASVQASPLPLVMKRHADGTLSFIGHFSRHNPQVELIRRHPKALLAFTGVQGYISSAWLSDRRYAPTWNYEVAHFEVEIELNDSPEAALAALRTLVAQMDADEASPWTVEESPRHAMLATYIVPFEAKVVAMQAQFKLGQGETPEVLADSLAGLRRHGKHELAAAMAKLHNIN
jgi:transcriptional regulator